MIHTPHKDTNHTLDIEPEPSLDDIWQQMETASLESSQDPVDSTTPLANNRK
jgi:hypothetical protein